MRKLGGAGIALQTVSLLLLGYSIYLAFVVSGQFDTPDSSWIFEAGQALLALVISLFLMNLGAGLQWRVFASTKHNKVLTIAILFLLLGISGNLLSVLAWVISDDQDIPIGQLALSLLKNIGLLAIAVWCYSRMEERDSRYEG